MMNIKSPLLLLLPIILLSVILLQCQASDGLLGGWTPIKNLNDPHVRDIANFAVSEHNKDANSNLALSRVVKGATQVVEGTNYKLLVAAKDGGKEGSYEVIVWEVVWRKFRKLTSFKPLNQ